MSVALKLDMPEGVFSALRKDPNEFKKELCLVAAVKWYEIGIVSQERASEIAGLNRADFIFSLFRFKVFPFQYTAEEIEKELYNAD
ncbi:MAG: UPF0175 family protein [bacterium]